MAFHEILVKKFTNIFNNFECLSSEEVEQARDPFGNLIIILKGIDFRADLQWEDSPVWRKVKGRPDVFDE